MCQPRECSQYKYRMDKLTSPLLFKDLLNRETCSVAMAPLEAVLIELIGMAMHTGQRHCESEGNR